MNSLKKELNIFLNALMFYTRIPVPGWVHYSDEILNKSTRYFTLTGLIIGGIGAWIYYLCFFIFPVEIAVLLSMVITVYATGAFHEDGFADFCDGFGGGRGKKQILTIMKDSRIGTYGSIGLVFILSLKFFTLINLSQYFIVIAMIAGHAFSRLFPVIFIYCAKYVRDDENAKAKPVGSKSSKSSLFIAFIFGLSALVLLPWHFLLVIIPVNSIVAVVFIRYAKRKINGYTGDVLGALQQISEVAFYVAMLVAKQIFH